MVVAVVLVAGVILTGSRAGLLALLAVVAIILPRGRARYAGLAVGAAAVAAVMVWRFLSQPDILAWFRPAIWGAVLRLWAEHPIAGVGPGGLVDAAGAVRLLHPDHVGQHQFLIAYAESSPLAILVQTGAVGFAAALAAVLAWGRAARARGAFESIPLRAALAVMVVMTLFHDLITSDIVLWWWAVALGLMEAPSLRITPVGESRPERRGASAVAALAVAYIILWGMVEPSWARWLWRAGPRDAALAERSLRAEPWYAAPLHWRTRDLVRRESWTWEMAAEAIARSRRAVRVRPSSAVLWGELGIVQTRVVTDFGLWPDSVEGAREAFARATELEPHQPWHWLEWARLERSLGNLEAASSLARRAIEAEPHAVRVWLFIARLELDRGQVEGARLAFREARDSAALRTRRGLNSYEKELVSAPEWQFRELEEALQ
jgi:cytochrome c-type biogenesis protein CcmH/NrfG